MSQAGALLENTTPPPPNGREISAYVIWGKKYKKYERERETGENVKEKKERGREKGK